jgi:stage II sporulation protein D
MHRLLAVLTLLAALTAATATTSGSAAPAPLTAFVLSGGGFGHGVGMSQWGAYGQAKAGRDYQQILEHYYRGTELGSAPAQLLEKVRVLVGPSLANVSVSSSATVVVIDGGGKRYRLPAPVVLGPTLELPVGKDGADLAVPGPVTLRPTAGASLAYGGRTFRGELQVSKVGARLQLVNGVGLEAYLLGVVPGEMPKDWPLEALKAQAVAARTYAVANLVTGKSFDLFSEGRSQLYYGVGSEAPGPSQAVRETRGQILLYQGKPALTFYFSSSGGRTVSALDAFGSDVPYLVSVDDPWDDASPNHVWATRLLNGSQLAKRFGLREAVADTAFVAGSPGKPAVLRLTTVAGGTADVRLSEVRARLGLRSTGFHLGLLRLDRPPAAANGVVRLSGIARDVADPVLEQRAPGGAWAPAKRLAPAANGAFAVQLKIAATTVYRLVSGGLAGPPLTIRIAA